MKHILIIISSFCFSWSYAQQVVITTNGTGATISIASGTNFNGPFDINWVNAKGFPIGDPCQYPNCDLQDVEPGRYCVTISPENIDDDENCEHEYATVTRCIDIVGTTCPDGEDVENVLTGEIVVEPTTLCYGDNRGTACFVGDASCFGNNIMYEWSNGVTSYTTSTPDKIYDLGPGTYCLKITGNDEVEPDNCECIGYFCATIGNRAKPLELDAEITQEVRCANTGQILSEGSVTLKISGGLPIYDWQWLNTDQSGINTTLTSETQVGKGPFCVQVTDNCGSSSIKCFEAPRRSIICPDGPPAEYQEDEKETPLSSLRIYPVPTSNELNVSFLAESSNEVNYQILNMSGFELLSSTYRAIEGDNNFTLNVSFLEDGMYLFRVAQLDSKTFIVLK